MTVRRCRARSHSSGVLSACTADCREVLSGDTYHPAPHGRLFRDRKLNKTKFLIASRVPRGELKEACWTGSR